MKMFMGGGNKAAAPGTGKDGVPTTLGPKVLQGTPLDLHIFVSEQANWQAAAEHSAAVWFAEGIQLAGKATHDVVFDYKPSEVSGSTGHHVGESRIQ